LVLLLGITFIRRPPKPLALLFTILMVAFMIRFVPAEYTQRMETLLSFLPGAEEQALEDDSFEGRLSANLSGWKMFTDQPITGVGLNNFGVHYLDYARDLGLEFDHKVNSPHSLYLQISSELGFIGLAWFAALNWVLFRGLGQARKDFIAAGKPQYADLAIALGLSLIAMYLPAMFTHASYPRYYWLLYGLAFAIPNIARRELEVTSESKGTNQDVSFISTAQQPINP
jgi:putative inorganic carbon (hco3(-)) transporter